MLEHKQHGSQQLLNLLHSWLASIITETLSPVIEDIVTKTVTQLLEKSSQKKLLTVEEVCEQLSISKPKVHSLFKRKLLERVKIPGSRRTYVKSSQLDELIITMGSFQK
jgi:excisionase family DNA binding protein